MPGHGTVIDLGRTLADLERLLVRAGGTTVPGPRDPVTPLQAELPVQIGTQAAASLHVERLVDRLVAHPTSVVITATLVLCGEHLGNQAW